MNGAPTIFALASAPGRAGVAIMRLSGPQAFAATKALLRAPLPPARRAALRKLYDPVSGELLDEALVLVFAGPASFTGEDMTELHLHGSPAVIEGVARALFSQSPDLHLRQARAGEFTRRAFENGRMDLTEAEGLADLIDAQTAGQRAQALRQMGGGLRAQYEGWRDTVLDALAQIEGEIDFADERDVPQGLSHAARPGLLALKDKLAQSLASSPRGEAVRHGVDIAIIGAPNAGKSSIINALSKKEAAIVSPLAGTTRDIVEVTIELAGLPVRLSDTAGLRQTGDLIEAEGVRRAQARAEQAELRLAVIDLSLEQGLSDEVGALLRDGDIIALNKSDIAPDGAPNGVFGVSRETVQLIRLSAHSQADIEQLTAQLERVIAERFGAAEQAGLTRARHRDCVQQALLSVERAALALGTAPELAGEELRRALHAIKELAGEADIEAVLDRIFSRFCIGK